METNMSSSFHLSMKKTRNLKLGTKILSKILAGGIHQLLALRMWLHMRKSRDSIMTVKATMKPRDLKLSLQNCNKERNLLICIRQIRLKTETLLLIVGDLKWWLKQRGPLLNNLRILQNKAYFIMLTIAPRIWRSSTKRNKRSLWELKSRSRIWLKTHPTIKREHWSQFIRWWKEISRVLNSFKLMGSLIKTLRIYTNK